MKTKHIILLTLYILFLLFISPVSAMTFPESTAPSSSTWQEFQERTNSYTSQSYSLQAPSYQNPMFRSGGGNTNTIDPNDPNWVDPNSGTGDALSVLTPIGDSLFILLFLAVGYIGVIEVRKRKYSFYRKG